MMPLSAVNRFDRAFMRKIMSFVSIIEGLRSRLYQENYNLTELIDDILDATGYLGNWRRKARRGQERIANIDELVNKLVTYADEPRKRPHSAVP